MISLDKDELDVTKDGARFVYVEIQHFIKRGWTKTKITIIRIIFMSADKLKEINNLIQQLQLLSVQQAELISRLDSLTQDEKQVSKKPAAVSKLTVVKQPLPTRELVIGDRVRIKNPRYLQPSSGKVTKLTLTRVTVTADNGTTIVRAAKNLILE